MLVASTRWPPAESHIVALLRIEAYKKYVGPTLPIPEPTFRRVPEAADRGYTRDAAIRPNRQHLGPLVTTEWILTEVGDAFSHPAARRKFIRLLDLLREQPDVEIVPSTSDLFRRGQADHISRQLEQSGGNRWISCSIDLQSGHRQAERVFAGNLWWRSKSLNPRLVEIEIWRDGRRAVLGFFGRIGLTGSVMPIGSYRSFPCVAPDIAGQVWVNIRSGKYWKAKLTLRPKP